MRVRLDGDDRGTHSQEDVRLVPLVGSDVEDEISRREPLEMPAIELNLRAPTINDATLASGQPARS